MPTAGVGRARTNAQRCEAPAADGPPSAGRRKVTQSAVWWGYGRYRQAAKEGGPSASAASAPMESEGASFILLGPALSDIMGFV